MCPKAFTVILGTFSEFADNGGEGEGFKTNFADVFNRRPKEKELGER